jgi:hypothetical protein
MRARLWLRAASVITVIFGVGHTLGAADSWSPPGDTAVLQAMKSFRFDAMGAARTYWDFYVGFGLYISVLLMLQGMVLWQLASIAQAEPVRVRPIIASFLVASMGCTFLTWRFIFAVPTLFSLAISACLATAFVAARRRAPS